MNIGETHLIVLQGITGSGKTQAAKYICSEMKTKYNIIAKIDATDKRTVFESLKKLADMIDLTPHSERIDESITIETLYNTIKNFLDHKHTQCLFVLDNVNYNKIDNFNYQSLLMKNTTGIRDFILTTNDVHIKTNHPSSHCIEFKGMDIYECADFFELYRKTNHPKIELEDIQKLVDKTGSLPMVINSVRQYIHVPGQSLSEYVNSLKNQKAEDIFKHLSTSTNIYGENIIESQMLPLLKIKTDLLNNVDEDKTLWKVMEIIPHLCCESVATTVLEACYFHLSNCETKCKIDKITFLVNECGKFSLCQIDQMKSSTFKDSTLLERLHSSKERKLRCLSFHEVTKEALKSLCQKTKLVKNIELELLKIFCYEIDIDARTDISIQRNMLFISHAKMFLNNWEKTLSMKKNTEVHFFLAYLHCAIGSTLLFQRIDVELAHIHLVKARKLCLNLANDESLFNRKTCPFIIPDNPTLQKLEIDLDIIKDGAQKVMHKMLNEEVVKEFIIHKRRSDHDLETIKSEEIKDFPHRDCHYFTWEEYTKLSAVELELALPLDTICKTFYSELLLRILLNSGRAFNELRYIKNDEKGHLKHACYLEFTTASEFCKLVKNEFPLGEFFFVCLETDRTGRMLMRFRDSADNYTDIDSDVVFYKNMIEEPCKRYFNFGILKLSSKANDRHICMCYRIILRLLQLKFSQSEDKHEDTNSILEKGRDYAETLLRKITDMNTEKINHRFKWIMLPLFYLQCAKFYTLSSDPAETKQALNLFNTAIDLEESRGVFWSRFMHEGCHGCLICLKRMKRHTEAEDLLKKIKSKLPIANMEKVISDLKNLHYERWN